MPESHSHRRVSSDKRITQDTANIANKSDCSWRLVERPQERSTRPVHDVDFDCVLHVHLLRVRT